MRAGDVVGVKRCMERIERVAAEFPEWMTDLHFARFHYRRLQGDHAGAYEAIAAALALVAPGRNANWARVTSAHVTALFNLGRHAEAAAHGAEYLAAAARAGFVTAPRELMLALIEPLIAVGQLERAAKLADECIAAYERVGSRGLLLGTSFELAARVAAARRDEPALAEYAARCARELRRGRSEVLVAQYVQLVHDVEQLGVTVPAALRGAAEPATLLHTSSEANARDIYARLAVLTDPAELAREALEVLMQSCGASTGQLFGVGDPAAVLLASTDALEPPPRLLQEVTRLLRDLSIADETATVIDTGTVADTRGSALLDVYGRRVTPVLLTSRREGCARPIAVAVLHVPAQAHPAPSLALQAAVADALWEHSRITTVASGR
jgi:hypothetical protein